MRGFPNGPVLNIGWKAGLILLAVSPLWLLLDRLEQREYLKRR